MLEEVLDGDTPRRLIDRMMLADQLTYLVDDQLAKVDRVSMAVGVEVRVPFVDQLVVESILTSNVAPRNGALPKQLLRDVVPTLPAKVRERAYKQGFSFPFRPWLSGPLRPLLGELVSAASAAYSDFLQPEACDRVLRAFDQGRMHWSRPWALAALCTTLSRT
jgi:asparagine synthase (glutamine-hydrolysing)